MKIRSLDKQLSSGRRVGVLLVFGLSCMSCDEIYAVVRNESDVPVLVHVAYNGGSSESVLAAHQQYLKLGSSPPFDISIRDAGPEHRLLYSGRTCIGEGPLVVGPGFQTVCGK